MKMKLAIQAQLSAVKSKQQQVALQLKETVVNIHSSKMHMLATTQAEFIPTSNEIPIVNQSDFLKVQNTILEANKFTEILLPLELLLDLLKKFKLPKLESLNISEIYHEYLQNRQVIAKLLVVSKNIPNVASDNIDKIGIAIRQLDTRCLALFAQQNKFTSDLTIRALKPIAISKDNLNQDRNMTKQGLSELVQIKNRVKS